MSKPDKMASRAQLQQDLVMKARQQQIQMMARQQQLAAGSQQNKTHQPSQITQPRSMVMGSHFDDLPTLEPEDFDHKCPEPSPLSSFDFACRDGPVSTIEETVTSKPRTPAFLHRGLLIALRAGNVETAQYLLSKGAPIASQTPDFILKAPLNKQIPLFELFTAHGWTPNTPGLYGAVLLPRLVNDLPLLSWFLANGANPNLGSQKDFHDRHGNPDTKSCNALEKAAARGSVEAVRMLLGAGARIQNGAPLHYAAGVCPEGANPHAGRVKPSKKFDVSRVPVMDLLVKNGADVNYKVESRHMEPQYAIVHAVMAGAMERVKWLLEQGADPFAKGSFGSAASYASFWGEEMEKIIDEGLAARNKAGLQPSQS
jgi:ankyrin repeat protein